MIVRYRALRRVVLVCGLVAAFAADAAEVEAQLDWVRRVELGTLVSGVVTELNVAPGAEVLTGQVLLRLDQRAMRARLDEAQARAKAAELVFAEAKREMERAQELYDRTVLSDHELMEAKIAFGKADVAKHSDDALLAQAQMDVQYSEIRAPFDAVVIKLNAQLGQVVANQFQSVPLVVIAESGRMAAQAEVDAQTAARWVIGSPARVRVGAIEYVGEVRAVGFEPVGRQNGGPRYYATVVFDTKKQILRAGQTARIEW